MGKCTKTLRNSYLVQTREGCQSVSSPFIYLSKGKVMMSFYKPRPDLESFIYRDPL